MHSANLDNPYLEASSTKEDAATMVHRYKVECGKLINIWGIQFTLGPAFIHGLDFGLRKANVKLGNTTGALLMIGCYWVLMLSLAFVGRERIRRLRRLKKEIASEFGNGCLRREWSVFNVLPRFVLHEVALTLAVVGILVTLAVFRESVLASLLCLAVTVSLVVATEWVAARCKRAQT